MFQKDGMFLKSLTTINMRKSSKRIPISAAKDIGKKFDKNQVILVTWNREHGDTWVTTWGKSVDDCVQAAEGGNFVKKALGWPNVINTKPLREKKLRMKIIGEIFERISKLETSNYIGLNAYNQRDVQELFKDLMDGK